jgi:hypothetical protein
LSGEAARPRLSRGHLLTRAVILVAFACAVGLLVHRLRRSPEQLALKRYVELLAPPLLDAEQPIDAELERLTRAPGLSAAEARALLIDDLIPRLLRLRRQAVEVAQHAEPAIRPLADEYLQVTDRVIDACRACVRIIDDPSLPSGASAVLVRERFAEVAAAHRAWEAHVRRACEVHHLVAPHGRP